MACSREVGTTCRPYLYQIVPKPTFCRANGHNTTGVSQKVLQRSRACEPLLRNPPLRIGPHCAMNSSRGMIATPRITNWKRPGFPRGGRRSARVLQHTIFAKMYAQSGGFPSRDTLDSARRFRAGGSSKCAPRQPGQRLPPAVRQVTANCGFRDCVSSANAGLMAYFAYINGRIPIIADGRNRVQPPAFAGRREIIISGRRTD